MCLGLTEIGFDSGWLHDLIYVLDGPGRLFGILLFLEFFGRPVALGFGLEDAPSDFGILSGGKIDGMLIQSSVCFLHETVVDRLYALFVPWYACMHRTRVKLRMYWQTQTQRENEFKQECVVYPDGPLSCVLIQFTYRTQRRSSSDHVSDVFRIEVAVGDVVLNHKILLMVSIDDILRGKLYW